MPEIEIMIGGRAFEVACQAGEEHYLEAAAAMLGAEAEALVSQTGRLPEARMLLMSGLMLADRTAGVEDRLKIAEDELDGLRAEIDLLNKKLQEAENAPTPEPEKVEVPVVPDSVKDTLAELAARAESLADSLDDAAKEPAE
jgi:cell division protein ZapA